MVIAIVIVIVIVIVCAQAWRPSAGASPRMGGHRPPIGIIIGIISVTIISCFIIIVIVIDHYYY